MKTSEVLLEELEEERQAMSEYDRDRLTNLQAQYALSGDLWDDHDQQLKDLINQYL